MTDIASHRAIQFGKEVAEQILGPASGKHMDYTDILALAAVAFDAGRKSIGEDSVKVSKNRKSTRTFAKTTLKRIDDSELNDPIPEYLLPQDIIAKFK